MIRYVRLQWEYSFTFIPKDFNFNDFVKCVDKSYDFHMDYNFPHKLIFPLVYFNMIYLVIQILMTFNREKLHDMNFNLNTCYFKYDFWV